MVDTPSRNPPEIYVTFSRAYCRFATDYANCLTFVQIIETVAGAIATTVGEGFTGLALFVEVVLGLPIGARTRRHLLMANV